jgi:cytochrome c biogenesis protein CcmG/thiol:disulfide interchange protein DsbE
MNRLRWNTLILVVLLVGVGWIWMNRAPGGKTQAYTEAPAIGYVAPDITLTDTDGRTFQLSGLRGRPVVLNFWATWCPPCRAELPELQAASQRLAGQVAIVGVNQGEAPAEVQAFAQQQGLTFQIPLDTQMEASRLYLVRNLPTTFFIDRSGVIREMQVGPLTEATLSQQLHSVYP